MFRVVAAEVSDQLFDARIDVGAIEGGDAGFDEGGHVALSGSGINRAVAAGQVPAALDDAGDVKAVASAMRGIISDSHSVAVTSERRNGGCRCG